jgi:hypothetical protein
MARRAHEGESVVEIPPHHAIEELEQASRRQPRGVVALRAGVGVGIDLVHRVARRLLDPRHEALVMIEQDLIDRGRPGRHRNRAREEAGGLPAPGHRGEPIGVFRVRVGGR